MLYGLTLIFLGILAIPSLVIARQPEAEKWYEKIEPFQGWIGFGFFFWGLWEIVSVFLNMAWLKYYPVWWFTVLAGGIVEAVLGFILGYNLLNKHLLSKNEEAATRGKEIRQKLVPLQGKIGLLGIALGLWSIFAYWFFY